jgi:uncharacterized membrane protein
MTSPLNLPSPRLRFIDMARSIAILLMLEGHFVDLTLAQQWRLPGHLIYDTWLYIRGMTAPMFFTVTGLVFAYLLSGAKEPGFWKIPRVRKGIIRAAELLIWGYLLQLNLRLLPALLRGEKDPWLEAFHVLQCIGVGLLGMILLFALARRTRGLPLAAIYASAAIAIYLLKIWLDHQPTHIPQNAPTWLQNTLKGPRSPFPIAPWLGYTFYGAALGVAVRALRPLLSKPTAPLAIITLGIALRFGGWWIDQQLAHTLLTLTQTPPLIIHDFFHGRIGEMLIVLGTLVWIENHYQPRDSWFLTIGQNTFPIYVAHVILLYGGIFGIGLRPILENRLNPWQASLGALLFVALFAALAQTITPLQNLWKTRKTPTHPQQQKP